MTATHQPPVLFLLCVLTGDSVSGRSAARVAAGGLRPVASSRRTLRASSS